MVFLFYLAQLFYILDNIFSRFPTQCFHSGDIAVGVINVKKAHLNVF